MTGKAHISAGIALTVIAAKYVKIDFTIMTFCISAFASLLPDVDHPKSMLNRYILPIKNKSVKTTIYFSISVCIFILNYLYFNTYILKIFALFIMLIGFSSHRSGVTHSITGLVIFSMCFSQAALKYGYGIYILPFFIGYSSHLILDMFTERGISLFSPFIKKKIKMPLTISVGTVFGNFIEGLIIVVSLGYITLMMPYILINMR